jgi:hypothetical protein
MIESTFGQTIERIDEFLMVIEDDPARDSFRGIGTGSELLAYIRDAA